MGAADWKEEREIRIFLPQSPTIWCCCLGVTAMGVFCWIFFTLHNLVSFEFGLYIFGNISTLLCPAVGPKRLTSVHGITWMLLPFACQLGSVSKRAGGDQGKGVSSLCCYAYSFHPPLITVPVRQPFSYDSSSLRFPQHYFFSIGMASWCCLLNFLELCLLICK